MESIEYKVEQSIKSRTRGTLLFPEDFSEFGSSEAIRKALQRLEEKGVIRRVAQGIYVCPVISKYFGEVLPSAEEVAAP